MRKAGKQFDKFSQSIGERLFKEGKTEHSSAFRDLEQDINLRARGMERLALASSTYIRSTGKKSKSEDPETSDGGKVLPGEGLGLVMISFGEQLGRDSDYGKSLVQIGRAKCKIAAIQDSYVEEIGEGYLAGLERAMDQIKDYQTLRKKLDSRRLAMDAANKRAASSKKDNRALDEEVRTSKARYDETQEDVEARMATIYESEGNYLDDLNSFLEAEVSFIDRYRDALLEAKNSLGSTSTSHSSRPSLPQRRPTLPPPSITHTRPRSSPPNDDPDDEPTPAIPISGNRARSNSTKSGDGKEKKSLFGSLRSKKSTPRKDTWGALSEDQDGLSGGRRDEEDSDRDYEEERDRRNGNERPEVSALGAGNRSRSFSSATVMGNSSSGATSTSHHAPGFPRRNTTPMRMDTGEKTVRSTFAYRGTASDELTFEVGDVIVVASEISADWWTGRLLSSGHSGLFPSAYTEPISPTSPSFSQPPPLPSLARPQAHRSASSSDLLPPPPRRLPPPAAARSNSFLTDSETEQGDPYGNSTSASEGEGDEGEKAGLTGAGVPAPPAASGGGSRFLGIVASGKKPPPPPPVSRSRRSTVSSRDEAMNGRRGQVDEGENPFH